MNEKKRMIEKKEAEFRKRIIESLEKAGVCVIDLGQGTFDLFIDDGRRLFIELKIVSEGYGVPFQTKKGINLSSQTEALRKMKRMPVIVAWDPVDDLFYLIPSKTMRKMVLERNDEPKVLIGARYIDNRLIFKNYDEMLAKLIKSLGAHAHP